MHSKSFERKTQQLEGTKQNKTFDFVNFYEPIGETKLKTGTKSKSFISCIEKNGNNSKENITKHEKATNRKAQKNNNIDISNIDPNTNSFISDLPLNDSKATSTPKLISKKSVKEVKSIMKINSFHNDTLDTTLSDVSSKRKKRNKSVSFRLDETDTVLVKKSKSEASQHLPNDEVKIKKLKKNKLSKQLSAEKENETTNSNLNTNSGPNNLDNFKKPGSIEVESIVHDAEQMLPSKKIIKKKVPRLVKIESSETEIQPNTKESGEQSVKKNKKKKRQAKINQDNADMEEPASKCRKKNDKPDLIAESLENLNIGDNAHTLTDLIDKMAVVDKSKKKKKPKKKKEILHNKDTPSKDESTEEVKEKLKWVKKKWNKGRNDFIHDDKVLTSVIIEDLPLSMMFAYKSILTERFSGCGQIKQIGIAELYPSDSPRPVFNSTIMFDTEDAATKALEEDNTLLEGSRIRVKRPLPHSQTTIVVRTYADLTEQTLSTLFSNAGRIRKINLTVKGKKIASTAFIEFDSPEAVERAIASAEGVQVNRKKINVFRYQEQYGKNKKGNKQEDREMNQAA